MQSWNDIYDYWTKANVPDIEVINFNMDEHHNGSFWYSKKHQAQFYNTRNPVEKTGHHLLGYLPGKDNEVKVAYQIHAYALEVDQIQLISHLINKAYQKHDETFHGWWGANTKYPLPIESEHWDSYWHKDTQPSIEMLVEHAAKTWQKVADELCLIRLPRYIETDDPHYLVYQATRRQRKEAEEYQLYLRLKAKFEGK